MRNESDFSQIAVCEKDPINHRIVFYTILWKCKSLKFIKEEKIMALHFTLKWFGAYKEIDGCMWVKKFYINEEIEKNLISQGLLEDI